MPLRKTRSGTRALQEIEANASPVGSTGSSETLVGTPEENKVQEEFPSPDMHKAPSTRKIVHIPDDPIDLGSSGLESDLDRTDEFSYESGKIPLPQSTQQSTPRVSFNQALFEQIKAQNVRPADIVVEEIPGQSGNPIVLQLIPTVPEMKSCVKLINPETLALSESVVEFLSDSTDFLVIGCLGYQGVGKSSIMSKIANLDSKETLFPLATRTGTGVSGTEGVDVFVTRERVILLDVEPLLSPTFLNGRSEDEPENDIEILSLQYAALLMTVCHIFILIQDSTFDPDLTRFLQAAEMLKPSTQSQPDDDPSLDYLPYVVLVHNKVESNLFARRGIKNIQDCYKLCFTGSQLPVSSGIGIASGTVLRSLTPEWCGEPLNLFLLPNYSGSEEQIGYNCNIKYNELMKKMTMQLLSLPPNPLCHPVLTEKNWWHYTHKMWEDIKKSTFFPEYGRLLPTQVSAKTELGNT